MHVKIMPPARLGRARLPGGRALGWAEWGPESGVPVLFCPGAGTSRTLGFGAESLAGLGVRLISLDRPGLGASDPDPGRTLASFPEDVRALGLGDDLRVAGFSQGAPFALACAARLPVRRAAIVSGADEVAAMPGALPAGLRDLVDQVAADPATAETFFATLTPDALWNMIVPNSPPADRAVYEQPDFDRAYRRAMAEAFVRGPAGYARDTVLAMGRWPIAPEEITVPVDLWYGELDTGHSPDQGRTLAKRIPGARHHLVPGVGGAVLWTHAETILRELLS
ncbi:alpha/beta fold hydrolase [Nonomuraea sp. NN258]|uniref:alpha/beta fold hydrolase n=1 Tax=Nonomuraea antri TaxID=2730852 RepID=UPI0015690AB1|nr:alpha/beta fold hydrolase [Nonomuraea antri]NRQ33048.1 alpha/beta fold hydrolase [Nonomuraea antri]